MKKKKKSWIGLGVIGSFLLSKLKLLLVVLKVAKLGSLLSVLISLGAYAMVYGWKFAAALVYLIYIHETGHLLAAKKKGIKTSAAIFIPFVGALISLKEQPKNANDEAFLAYWGPLVGTIGFLPAFPLYFVTHSPFWLLVISLGAMINLFNLIPLHPMDGGRIAGVISTKFWLLGIAGMGIYLWFRPSAILFIFLLLGIIKGWSEFRKELTRKKREKVIEVYRDGVRKIEQYYTSEENRIFLLNRWKWELEEIKRELRVSKKRYLPFKDDEQWINKQSLLFKAEVYQQLLSQSESSEATPYFEIRKSFQKEIKMQEDQLQFENTYYAVDAKTKGKWSLLYAGLAVFLMIATFYTGGQLRLNV